MSSLKKHIDSVLSDIIWSEDDARAVYSRIEKENEPMKRKTLKLALVCAVVCAFTVTCLAVGERMGLIDFVGRYQAVNLPEDVAQYVDARGERVYEDENLVITLREVLFDGLSLRFVADVEPKDEKTFVLCFDEELTDFSGGFALADRYQAGGYTRVMQLSMHPSDEETYPDNAFDAERIDSGASVYCDLTGHGYRPDTDAEIAFSYAFLKDPANDDYGVDSNGYTRNTFRVRAQAPSDENLLVCETPVEYPHFGVTVEKLILTRTPVEIGYGIYCVVTDPEAYAENGGGLFFEFVDPNSAETEPYLQRLSKGIRTGEGLTPIDDTHFAQYGALALDEEHATYYIRAFDPFEDGKPRYETGAFQVK